MSTACSALCARWVLPSFILAIRASSSCGFTQSLLLALFFLFLSMRVRSSRALSTLLRSMKIPSCASLHRSAAASAKSWNDPQVAHPTRSPEIPAVPTNPLPATRSPVQNRCLQNSPAVTTESRSPASPTDAHCSLRRTSRIPSPQSYQTSLPPKVHSLSYKMDGPAPSLPHRD